MGVDQTLSQRSDWVKGLARETRSMELATMTWSVARPPYLGALSAGNLSMTLLLATVFFFDYLKISSAKDVSTALNRQS